MLAPEPYAAIARRLALAETDADREAAGDDLIAYYSRPVLESPEDRMRILRQEIRDAIASEAVRNSRDGPR